MPDFQLIFLNPAFFYSVIALLSLAVGSFLNVVIYRLPIMLHQQWLRDYHSLLNLPEPASNAINLFKPRSFCSACNNTVKAIHNIPLLSYLWLGGRCHNCQTPISCQYPLVELLTVILSCYAAWHFGYDVKLVYGLLFIWLLIPLFFIDLKHQLLPDNLTLTLLWLGLIANTQGCFIDLSQAVLAAAGAYLILWIFVKLFYLATRKIGMGHGDFKLFAAFGAWFGYQQLFFIILLSSFTGAIIGSAILVYKKQNKNTPIAFGPFLCFAGLIALFWGDNIINWYLYLLNT